MRRLREMILENIFMNKRSSFYFWIFEYLQKAAIILVQAVCELKNSWFFEVGK